MRVGILTLHWVPNFGANLQVYAMSQIIQSLGHEPIIINYRASNSVIYHGKRVLPQQSVQHESFLNDTIIQTEIVTEENTFSELIKKNRLDVVVIGSDAVFRVGNSIREDLNYRNPFWANWQKAADVPVIGCSVSAMGKNLLFQPKERKWISERIKKSFLKISVRDTWTLLQVSLLGLRKVSKTCDPVLWMDQKKAKFCPLKTSKNLRVTDKKYVVVCFLKNSVSRNWVSEFRTKMNLKGLLVVSLPHPEGQDNLDVDINVQTPLSPNQWYTLIANSSGLFAQRFHPIVVAAANSIPFVAIDNYRVGSHLYDFFIGKFRSKTYEICAQLGVRRCNVRLKDLEKKNSVSVVIDLFDKFDIESVSQKRERLISHFINYLSKSFDNVGQLGG